MSLTAQDPKERKETPTVDVRNYLYDFFSGANIGLWFHGVLLAEAVGVEFSLAQTKRPVYGWASTLFDGVAGGIVQAAGSLYVNFRQAHLFTALLDRASGSVNKSEQVWYPISAQQRFSTLVTGLTDTEIDNFEKRYWGPQGNGLENPTAEDITSNAKRRRRPDAHASGFDILITYGDMMKENPAANSTARRLYGVQVTGFGQTVEIDGKPVLEAYNFLCRQVL